MNNWQKILRNGAVVFGILLSQNLVTDFLSNKMITLETCYISFIIAVVWTMYEFKRVFKINLTNGGIITKKKGATTLLLS